MEVGDKPREACGVFGIWQDAPKALGSTAYLALLGLQHRGQDGAGIAIYNKEQSNFVIQKDLGLVTEVFKDGQHLEGLPMGQIAIGHNSYSTSGAKDNFEGLQPLFSLGSGKQLVLAHNGHIDELSGLPGGETDTQVLVEMITEEMKTGMDVVAALKKVTGQLANGAYSLVLSDGDRLVGMRDSRGFRPLMIGENDDGYCLASESSALAATDFHPLRDVDPGEVVVIDEKGITSIEATPKRAPKLCGMEYAYFSRPDTDLDGINIQTARERMGETLARKEAKDFHPDMIVGVPDSGVPAAHGYAREIDIPLEQALVKNRYVTRTFIKSTQADREHAVLTKLSPNRTIIEGKKLVVVDDSIVRGTTTKTLVSMLKDAGAAEVHLRISWPPYKWPCYFGMDTGRPEELIASQMSEDEICEYIGADSLKYISTDEIKGAIGTENICTACADGDYPSHRHNDQ